MMKNRNFDYVIIALFGLYLLVDVVHFFSVRINIEELFYLDSQAVYESHLLSFVKWSLGVISLAGFYLMKTSKKNGEYLLFGASLLILLIFFLKGHLTELMIGSFAFDFWVLEIASVLSLLLFTSRNGHKISLRNVGITTAIVLVVFFGGINLIPSYLII